MITRPLKRLFDILASAAGLLLLSPLLLWLAWRVRTQLGAPIFFRQTRIGKGEKPFRLMKFRTMTDARDAQGNLLPDDQRMHPFGTWLRATSLDELPELWNIFTGAMSVVGPRPLLPAYLPYYTPREALRHTVRPGLTGLAQVSGRNALSWSERLEWDAHYVEGLSLLNDAQILWRTVAIVLKKEGISAEGQVTMHRLDDERKAASHA